MLMPILVRLIDSQVDQLRCVSPKLTNGVDSFGSVGEQVGAS